ncbi:hypothetical protein F0562_021303 [Nyssa sinensis]|uniref:Uncharacterized protein n=1 Tax=Nyssa sinensis TaxID=561372 RepID=A0A5J5BN84_9ASTE|nr:hypothetical protein F0562_021303 [Nyssa sinensis]
MIRKFSIMKKDDVRHSMLRETTGPELNLWSIRVCCTTWGPQGVCYWAPLVQSLKFFLISDVSGYEAPNPRHWLLSFNEFKMFIPNSPNSLDTADCCTRVMASASLDTISWNSLFLILSKIEVSKMQNQLLQPYEIKAYLQLELQEDFAGVPRSRRNEEEERKAILLLNFAKSSHIQDAVLLYPSLVTVDDIKEVKRHLLQYWELRLLSPPELLKQSEEILSTKYEVNGYVKIFLGIAMDGP